MRSLPFLVHTHCTFTAHSYLLLAPLLLFVAATWLAEDDGSPMFDDSLRRATERRQGISGSRSLTALAAGGGWEASGSGSGRDGSGELLLCSKRARLDYATPDLPAHADRQRWLQAQAAAFNATAAAAAAETLAVGSSGGDDGGGERGGEGSGNQQLESQPQQERQQERQQEPQQRQGKQLDSFRASSSRSSSMHAAIFSLVYGLLDEGEDRRAFGEVYLPWLNDLPPWRLGAEFATMHGYLRLLRGGLEGEAVRGLIGAYLRSILARASGAAPAAAAPIEAAAAAAAEGSEEKPT